MKKIYIVLCVLASLVFKAQPIFPGVIAADQTVCAGSFPAPLTSVSSATVSAGVISYQWEFSTVSASSGFAPIGSANLPTYAPGSVAATTYYRRIASTAPTNTASSNVITITVLPLSILQINGPSMVCAGLSLTLSASTGTSWTWSPAAPNSQSLVLSPVNNGVVNVTVTLANGCTVSSQPYGYTVNSVPTVTNSYIDTTACEGLTNHIVVKVVPPAGNTFIWQPGNMTGPSPSIIVSSTLTAYSVTITNGFGCKTSTLVTYTVYPLPVITATSAANPVCSGAQTTLTASGGVMYGWLPGNPTPIIAQSITVAPTTATTYTVVGFDGYCPNTATITQSVSVLTPTFVANRDKMCITRESVLLTVYGGTAHAWLNPGITATTPSIVVSPTITTSYSVIITGANSCTALAVKSITVNACTGIEANNQAQAFRIYPNPSNGEFFISSATDINIRIMNNAGQLIRQFHLSNDNDYKVSVADLVPGIYFVVSESEGRNSTQKIVITK